MRYIHTQPLEGERLLLCRADIKYAQKLFDNWGSHDETTKYVLWDTHEDILDTRIFLRTWINSYMSPDVYRWVITIKDTDEPIGTISVGSMNKLTSSCDVGYSLGPSFWGNGYATEALSLVIKFLFEEAECRKITASHMAENIQSGRVMEKCGMKRERILRNRNLGKVKTDVWEYVIMRDDYFGN